MRVNILRQRNPGSEPYWESFQYEGPQDNTIAGLLDWLNYNDDPVNEQGEKAPRISWECSCLQAVCGSCAMVINNIPALACETFLNDLKGEEITIQPLKKFPVICDLVTDRSQIQENLKDANACIREYHPDPTADFQHRYLAAKCLKCGLCLEVCPNYRNSGIFYGALFANDCWLISTANTEKTKEVQQAYDQHFGAVCSRSLTCMDVCPVKIPTITSMAALNKRRKRE